MLSSLNLSRVIIGTNATIMLISVSAEKKIGFLRFSLKSRLQVMFARESNVLLKNLVKIWRFMILERFISCARCRFDVLGFLGHAFTYNVFGCRSAGGTGSAG